MKRTSKSKKIRSKDLAALRERAEKLLHGSPVEIPPHDVAAMLNELQIHQVKLEIQNEELRSAQEKLEESRNRYYDLYDFAPVGYFTISPFGAILEANLAGADMLEVVRSRLLGKLFQGFVSPEDLHIFQAHIQRVLKAHEKEACEFRAAKEGRALFCRMESACTRDKQGTPVSIRSALLDISMARLAQEEMRQAKEGFAALAENSWDIISRRDRDLRCAYINPAVVAISRFPVHGLEKAGVEMEKTIKIVLMADDDEDDTFLVRRAFAESGNPIEFRSVPNGEDLLDYLFRRGRYKDPLLFPDPSLVLLDLNMPRKGGQEALAEIKADPMVGKIPVVIYSTSSNELDIRRCYELGADSYVIKPGKFDDLVDVLKTTAKYWLETVELPCYDPLDRELEKRSEPLEPEVLGIDKRRNQNTPC